MTRKPNNYDLLLTALCTEAIDGPQKQDFIRSIVDKVLDARPDIIGTTVRRKRIAYHISICLGCIKHGKEFVAMKNRPPDEPCHKPNQSDIDVSSLLDAINKAGSDRIHWR